MTTTTSPPQPTHLEQVLFMLAAHVVFRYRFLQTRKYWLSRTNLQLSDADTAMLLSVSDEQLTQHVVALRETLTPEGISWFSEFAQDVLNDDARLVEKPRPKDLDSAPRPDVSKGMRPDRGVSRSVRFAQQRFVNKQACTLGNRPDIPPLKPK